MDPVLPGTSVSDSIYSPGGVQDKGALDKDAFMKLLVTQLGNQNPLEPTPNEEFVAQLANFSSLEQMELMNENIVSMVLLNQGNALMAQLTSGSALIGQEVEWADPNVGTPLGGTVESVKVKNGEAVLSINGEDVPLSFVTEVKGQSTAETTDA